MSAADGAEDTPVSVPLKDPKYNPEIQDFILETILALKTRDLWGYERSLPACGQKETFSDSWLNNSGGGDGTYRIFAGWNNLYGVFIELPPPTDSEPGSFTERVAAQIGTFLARYLRDAGWETRFVKTEPTELLLTLEARRPGVPTMRIVIRSDESRREIEIERAPNPAPDPDGGDMHVAPGCRMAPIDLCTSDIEVATEPTSAVWSKRFIERTHPFSDESAANQGAMIRALDAFFPTIGAARAAARTKPLVWHDVARNALTVRDRAIYTPIIVKHSFGYARAPLPSDARGFHTGDFFAEGPDKNHSIRDRLNGLVRGELLTELTINPANPYPSDFSTLCWAVPYRVAGYASKVQAIIGTFFVRLCMWAPGTRGGTTNSYGGPLNRLTSYTMPPLEEPPEADADKLQLPSKYFGCEGLVLTDVDLDRPEPKTPVLGRDDRQYKLKWAETRWYFVQETGTSDSITYWKCRDAKFKGTLQCNSVSQYAINPVKGDYVLVSSTLNCILLVASRKKEFPKELLATRIRKVQPEKPDLAVVASRSEEPEFRTPLDVKYRPGEELFEYDKPNAELQIEVTPKYDGCLVFAIKISDLLVRLSTKNVHHAYTLCLIPVLSPEPLLLKHRDAPSFVTHALQTNFFALRRLADVFDALQVGSWMQLELTPFVTSYGTVKEVRVTGHDTPFGFARPQKPPAKKP